MSHRFPAAVLITGASGAIGGALAEAYAKPGVTLILAGRDEDRLSAVAALCGAMGAKVSTKALDVTNTGDWMAWLTAVDERDPLDLVIVNAAVTSHIGSHGAGERWEAIEAVIDTNITASLATVHAVLPGMRRRGRGQIALMSSLAAYVGLPSTPSYCASKAALRAYGEALRGWLAPEGIRVNVVMPGFVESRMARETPGPKPFLWSAERAARVIRRGLASDRPRISFPFPLSLGTWLLSVMHPSISERIVRLAGYGG